MNKFYSPLARNIILDTDSYKNDHQRMLPPDTKEILSAIVPRKGNQHTNLVKVFGQQYLLKQYLTMQLSQAMIDEAEQEIIEQGYPFDRKRWEYILNAHKGYLPLEIRAIPEGMVVPIGLPIMTIRNTDDKCAWLVSYIETMLHRIIWKMTTVASVAADLYRYFNQVMIRHTGLSDNVSYQLHNFGSRGADSYESDIMSGMAHLAAGFKGTDCLQANRNIKHYYNTQNPIGSSVLATEHSVICAYSDAKNSDDYNAAVQMLEIWDEAITRFNNTGKGTPILSLLGDTYDIYRFTREYLGIRLKNKIIELGKKGGRLVLRPDSGDPKQVPIDCIETLMECFGYTTNTYGYKVLPDYLRVIQGDGVTTTSIRTIVDGLEERKLSLENLVLGMGGGLTHGAGRDEFSFSMKATAILGTDGWRELFKNPVTDSVKKSLRGRVTTYKDDNGRLFAESIEYIKQNRNVTDIMETIFVNGIITREYTFEEILSH